MRRKIDIWTNIDWFTVILYLILVLLGWINIYSAVYNEEHQSIFDFSQRYGKQLIWISAALFVAIIVMIIDSNFYSFFAYGIYFFVLLLLIAVLLFGKEIHGSRAWLEIGSVRFQPAEFAKIATALVLARYLSTFNVKLNKFRSYLRVVLIILAPFALIFIQDAGTALVFAAFLIPLYREGLSAAVLLLGLYVVLLFTLSFVFEKIYLVIGTILLAHLIALYLYRRLKYVLVALAFIIGFFGLLLLLNYLFKWDISLFYLLIGSLIPTAVILLIFAYWYKIRYVLVLFLFIFGSTGFTYSVDYVFNNFLEPHQQTRINHILGIEESPHGAGYNVNQSKIAIGSGGFWGKGFLQGTQTKFDFVPEQSTDFIFSTIGEEWGFVGSLVLIGIFVTFLLRIIYLAERQRSTFSRIYGYSVFSVFFIHFLINIGMTIGLVPVIGIPLPFISYGGSSLWSFTILLFIFLKLDVSRLRVLR
jgi:rod shape determining protein RodA